MQIRIVSIAAVALAAFAAAACEATKSSNPLTPTVAGPIPGVDITAPKILEPASGTKIAVDKQPITLMVENASSNGVRPLNYTFEIATDAAFANKVFSRESITPGDNGRTALKLPDALASGGTTRSYFWRTRAQDGANTGSFASSSFDVFTPIVIGAPQPTSPAPNATTSNLRPSLTINNAPRSGPVGAISYLIEVATDGQFSNKFAAFSRRRQRHADGVHATARFVAQHGMLARAGVRSRRPRTVFGDLGIPDAAEPAPEPVPVPVPGPIGRSPAARSTSSARACASPAGVAKPATANISSIHSAPTVWRSSSPRRTEPDAGPT
jgi:hypothetical protein